MSNLLGRVLRLTGQLGDCMGQLILFYPSFLLSALPPIPQVLMTIMFRTQQRVGQHVGRACHTVSRISAPGTWLFPERDQHVWCEVGRAYGPKLSKEGVFLRRTRGWDSWMLLKHSHVTTLTCSTTNQNMDLWSPGGYNRLSAHLTYLSWLTCLHSQPTLVKLTELLAIFAAFGHVAADLTTFYGSQCVEALNRWDSCSQIDFAFTALTGYTLLFGQHMPWRCLHPMPAMSSQMFTRLDLTKMCYNCVVPSVATAPKAKEVEWSKVGFRIPQKVGLKWAESRKVAVQVRHKWVKIGDSALSPMLGPLLSCSYPYFNPYFFERGVQNPTLAAFWFFAVLGAVVALQWYNARSLLRWTLSPLAQASYSQTLIILLACWWRSWRPLSNDLRTSWLSLYFCATASTLVASQSWSHVMCVCVCMCVSRCICGAAMQVSWAEVRAQRWVCLR